MANDRENLEFQLKEQNRTIESQRAELISLYSAQAELRRDIALLCDQVKQLERRVDKLEETHSTTEASNLQFRIPKQNSSEVTLVSKSQYPESLESSDKIIVKSTVYDFKICKSYFFVLFIF